MSWACFVHGVTVSCQRKLKHARPSAMQLILSVLGG